MAAKRLVAAQGRGGRVHVAARHRLADAATGTLVAAVWTTLDGYGLTLDDIEAALTGEG